MFTFYTNPVKNGFYSKFPMISVQETRKHRADTITGPLLPPCGCKFNYNNPLNTLKEKYDLEWLDFDDAKSVQAANVNVTQCISPQSKKRGNFLNIYPVVKWLNLHRAERGVKTLTYQLKRIFKVCTAISENEKEGKSINQENALQKKNKKNNKKCACGG